MMCWESLDGLDDVLGEPPFSFGTGARSRDLSFVFRFNQLGVGSFVADAGGFAGEFFFGVILTNSLLRSLRLGLLRRGLSLLSLLSQPLSLRLSLLNLQPLLLSLLLNLLQVLLFLLNNRNRLS